MDFLSRHLSRAVCAGCLLAFMVVSAVCWSPSARAQSDSGPTYAQAMASCQGWLAGTGNDPRYGACQAFVMPSGGHVVCAVVPAYGHCYTNNVAFPDSEISWVVWYYTGSAPGDNPCSKIQPQTGQFAGKGGTAVCLRGVDAGNGTTVACALSFVAKGAAVQNQWGAWTVYGTATPTGDTCDGTKAPWKNAAGQDVDPQPADPSVTPPKATPAKTCGGGSCYDPVGDQYCATSGGSQVCVPGPAARSGQGVCATSGDGTLCAGSPVAAKPDPSRVPDPATQVNSMDKYTQSDPATGANQTVTTTTYNVTPGTKPASGQGSGDSGPPPSSGDPASSSSAAGSYGGGGDCDSPPVCSGDAVLCGIGRQSWAQMCQLHKDLSDSSTVSDSDTGVPDMDGVDDAVQPEKRTLLDRLDFSGFGNGGAVCPAFLHISVPALNIDYEPDPEYWCQVLSVFGQLFMLFCTYEAIMILGKR